MRRRSRGGAAQLCRRASSPSSRSTRPTAPLSSRPAFGCGRGCADGTSGQPGPDARSHHPRPPSRSSRSTLLPDAGNCGHRLGAHQP
eukprot:11082420-Prorocentrum_lima.AAC.1